MNTSCPSKPNPFQNLPDDLKSIIFKYIPLMDYGSLSLVCRDFYSFLKKNPELWAQQLFKHFLDVVPKESPFAEENFFETVLLNCQEKIKFSEMKDSRKLIIQHHNVMNQWKSFFSGLLSVDDCQEFIKDVFSTVAMPDYPPPCLKKDTHYFPTNTLFQNFLTEVYFEVHGRPFFQETRQVLVEKMAKNMKGQLMEGKVNKDQLLATRWYLFNHERKENANLHTKASLLCRKSKVIKKRVLIKRKADFPGVLRKVKNSKAQSRVARTQASRADRKIERSEKFALKKQECADIEEFYWMLHDLMENYCKMIFSYLKAIHDPYLLIAEYTRLWNKYALLIMDFAHTFNPFAELFNTLYEDVCRGLPSFPKFSTWRLMVKVWISQVFSNLSYFLGEAFRAILMKVRSQKKASGVQKAGDTENCSFCRTQRISDGSNAPYDHFFYKIERNEKERKDIPLEELVKMLKGFYYSVDDISYNEFSIFYWDCTPSDKRTPKGILDSLVLQDTKIFYEHFKECFWQGSSHYKAFLIDDNEFIEKIFGKQFGYEMRQLQNSAIKDYLADIFNHALKETESLVKGKDAMVMRRKLSVGSHINLREFFRFVSIDAEMQKRVLETQKRKDLIMAKLGNNGRVLNSYMFYLEKEQEEIEEQVMEFEEMRSHRALRGFVVTDEKYNKFFELGQNPSLTEIQKVGLEGKNIKEEVESAEDTLVLL